MFGRKVGISSSIGSPQYCAAHSIGFVPKNVTNYGTFCDWRSLRQSARGPINYREEEKKIQKFAKMEISEQSLKKVGEEVDESEKDVVDAIKAAKGRKSTFIASREDYK